MFQFLRSSIRFTWRVTKRAWAGIVWFLLDVSEVYSKLIAPHLPPEWVAWLKPYTVWLDVAMPWVVAGFVFLVICYTYYEVERQITRNPEIPKKLREFYVKFERYSRCDLQNEDQFPEWKNAVKALYQETNNWIIENMSDAADSRFTDSHANMISNAFHIAIPGAINNEHDQIVTEVNHIRRKLQDLIENEAWD